MPPDQETAGLLDGVAESALVVVTWLDSRGMPGEWISESDVRTEPCRCMSVGWVFRLTDEAVTLVNHRFPDKSNSQVADYIVIPRCSIQTVKVLTLALDPSRFKSLAQSV